MSKGKEKHVVEHWGSRLGVILAVSGSAIGLGNFLRFPGQAANYGGGAFMIPYLLALLFVAIPIALTEWTLGRYGGTAGYHSPMGIYYHGGGRRRLFGVGGGLFTFTSYVIDMYYLFIEGWCLFYALEYLGAMLDNVGLGFSLIPGQNAAETFATQDSCTALFSWMSGVNGNGSLFNSSAASVLIILAFCSFINFYLIYRGISKGVERFCKAVAPLILLCSIIIVVRVLTLGNPTGIEGQSLLDGLGFMWNPQNLKETLSNPEVWLAATSQIFFSTSLCTSAVLSYSSYIRAKQDVAMSSLTATMANEFCEVCLGGLMIIPPAIMFLGTAAADQFGSSFSLGFVVLPNVFSKMYCGNFFGFVFFSLLFFAAITSSISQIQPIVAFYKEAFGWKKHRCVIVAALSILCGLTVVCYLTKDLVALDVFDFWSANLTPFMCAIVQTAIVAYVMGRKKFCEEADRGAVCKLSKLLYPIAAYISLPYLVVVFIFWLTLNFKGRMVELANNPSATISFAFLMTLLAILFVIAWKTTARWKREDAQAKAGVKEETTNATGENTENAL